MRRHELNLSTLVAGAVFLVIGTAAVVATATDRALDGRWMLPVLLIGLGISGLVSTVRTGRGRRTAVDDAALDDHDPAAAPPA